MTEATRRRPWRWWPVLLLIVGAAWICAAMWKVDWWHSHETVYYPVRVREYLRAWSGGAWYPRWCPDLYAGYGYPFLDFYAPVTYATGAALTPLAGSPSEALKVAMTVFSVAGALGVFGLIHGETRRFDAALIGGALYVFFPYRCTDLFARGDLAEYSAYCFVPFAVWAYRSIDRASAQHIARAAALAALAHAAVILTHTIVGFFLTELVGAYVLVRWIRERRAVRTATLLAGAALVCALLLAAIYLIPVLLERHLVHLERFTGDRFQAWTNLVPFKALTDPFFTPGLAAAVALAAWLVAAAVPRWRPAARSAAGWWGVALLLFALLLPWAGWCWHIVPFGKEVQFPWRLYGFIGLFAATGLGVLWAALVPAARGLAVAILLVAPMPFLLHSQRAVFADRRVPDTIDEIRTENTSTTVMNEYLPKKVVEPVPVRDRLAWSDDPRLTVHAEQVDALTYVIDVDTPAPAPVMVALFKFPGWHLRTLEGPPGAKLLTARGGFLRVRLPAAGHYKLEIHFGSTPSRTLAALISLLALLACYPLMRLIVRRRPPG